jgi:hypothetical protein
MIEAVFLLSYNDYDHTTRDTLYTSLTSFIVYSAQKTSLFTHKGLFVFLLVRTIATIIAAFSEIHFGQLVKKNIVHRQFFFFCAVALFA